MEVLNMFINLIMVVVVSWVYTYLHNHQILYIEYVVDIFLYIN